MRELLAQVTQIDPKSRTVELGSTQSYGIERNEDLGKIISNAITVIMIFGAIAVLFMFAWGAFEWITSGGDKERVAGARRKIIQAFVGLLLLALAFLIISTFGQIVGLNPLQPFVIPRLGTPIR